MYINHLYTAEDSVLRPLVNFMNNQNKQILLINDICGYGKVALSAMIPILTNMGYHIYNLPTALVSNTLEYGKFRIQDTTDYMRDSIKVWQELGFSFDAISTGLITSSVQADLLIDFCGAEAKKGVLIFVDPIMADNGSLYNGMTMETVANMKRLLQVAYCTVPNYTEAVYLTDSVYKDDLTQAEVYELIDKLRALGAKSVVITSCHVDGSEAVAGYSDEQKEYFVLPYVSVPVFLPGTGDIFLSVLMGQVLQGKFLKASVAKSMEIVKRMVLRNKDNADKFKGIRIEACLDVLQ